MPAGWGAPITDWPAISGIAPEPITPISGTAPMRNSTSGFKDWWRNLGLAAATSKTP